MTTEKDHTRTRPVQQNSSKETVITLDFQKAMEVYEDILESLLSLVFNATRAELFGISIVRADQF